MQQACSFTIPETHFHATITTSFTAPNLPSIAGHYGLASQSLPDAHSGTHDITVTNGQPGTYLPDELALLDPLEAILCGQDIYVNDSRISLGASILVESRSPSVFPQIGLNVALTLCFARQGAVTLHASGFRYQGMDLLALGPSRSGKSTLSGAVLSAGGRVLTDDNLICYLKDGVPHARWLRRDLLMREGGLDALSQPLKQQATPVEVAGEPRWNLSRSRLAEHFVDELRPCALLYLCPPHPDTAPRPDSIPVLAPISHSVAFAQLINASSPALFSSSAIAVPGLPSVCRDLLAATTHYQLTTSCNLVRHPREELSRLIERITADL